MTDIIERPIPESYWVEPGRFLAGEYPSRTDASAARNRLDAFLAAGINSFFDLTHAGELNPYDQLVKELAQARGVAVSYTRIPIRDHGIPTVELMSSLLDRIDQALTENKRIYVHCWGGIGRTGTTVGCYLIRHGLTNQGALQQIAGWWTDMPKRVHFPRSPETDEQVEFILNWKENRSGNE
jgi:protein-tyrosine phosphatase